CSLRAKVPSTRAQVIVVKVPDHRRPAVVEHPLNHAARRVLIAAVCFEHRANAFVRLELRLCGVILKASRRAVASVERVSEDVKVLEFAAPGVKVPPVINWPLMFLRQHRLDALDRRHSRAGTGFGIESVPSPASAGVAILRMTCSERILFPIGRGYIFIRPAHLYAAVAADRCRLSCSR